MDNTETGRIVDNLIAHAKYNYECQQWLKNREELYKKLDNPMLLQTKAEALNVCDMLIQQGIDNGTIPLDSVSHRLGLRLMDYLLRYKDEK